MNSPQLKLPSIILISKKKISQLSKRKSNKPKNKKPPNKKKKKKLLKKNMLSLILKTEENINMLQPSLAWESSTLMQNNSRKNAAKNSLALVAPLNKVWLKFKDNFLRK